MIENYNFEVFQSHMSKSLITSLSVMPILSLVCGVLKQAFMCDCHRNWCLRSKSPSSAASAESVLRLWYQIYAIYSQLMKLALKAKLVVYLIIILCHTWCLIRCFGVMYFSSCYDRSFRSALGKPIFKPFTNHTDSLIVSLRLS